MRCGILPQTKEAVLEEFYLFADGHEVWILRVLPRIIAGRDAAEFPEVIDEVGLIVIAAAGRDLGPRQSAAALNLVDRPLKPAHAAKYFRRHSYLFGKDFDEPAATESDFRSDFADSDVVRLAREAFERVEHGAMTRGKSAPAREQCVLEDAELGGRAGCLE